MLPYVACRIKYKKDKKTTTGHGLTIGPEGYLSSPYTGTNDVSNPPVNQEGDLPSFCNTLNNEVADHQVAADAQPQTSLEEIMNSLSPLETLDDCLSNYVNTPTYQPQAQADEGSSSFFDFSSDNSMQELSKLFRSSLQAFLAFHICQRTRASISEPDCTDRWSQRVKICSIVSGSLRHIGQSGSVMIDGSSMGHILQKPNPIFLCLGLGESCSNCRRVSVSSSCGGTSKAELDLTRTLQYVPQI
ncbi:hypothetical protein NL676_015887 [Syzygium grande]|nr:hypothetical protein NL676_015887 [Syzygium grande]